MDLSIQRDLHDKLYDKRKIGALNLQKLIREASASNNSERIQSIIHQLCADYALAYNENLAVRYGGLIGLAATSIALEVNVAPYLQDIVPAVLACSRDQDSKLRYYACESMYNIAKVAKGEILVFFNDIFDSLCKLAADSELSVKNGAELLDRLIKDIVSESASSYVSVLHDNPDDALAESDPALEDPSVDLPTAFSLARFIPLLQERIHVLSPFTRTFLVSWITLLDSIPDLELVFYLPAFLGGLFKFLSDPNRDVNVATQGVLERFLSEIKRIARIKRGIEESRKGRSDGRIKRSPSNSSTNGKAEQEGEQEGHEQGGGDTDSATADDGNDESTDGDWVPGQDVHVDHPKILEILVNFLDSTSGIDASATLMSQIDTNHHYSEEEIQLTALRWIDSFFEICPEDILQFVPRLLSQVLPAMSSDVEQVRQAANRVNTSLMEYIVSLSDQSSNNASTTAPAAQAQATSKDTSPTERRDQNAGTRESDSKRDSDVYTPPPPYTPPSPQQTMMDLDYSAAVNSLTLQFLNEHEATRVGALTWLIMLHRRAPRKVLAINDETFPALLKTLSDPAEAVVTRDLQLLSQISKNSEDSYFSSFMVNLLQLFATDRRLLETRGNLIIRQLCLSLSAERIYRTLADCLERDEVSRYLYSGGIVLNFMKDVEFASIMVQNLNNNLITAPELADLRKRLRNLETREGQTFFVTLFRSWCHNAVATFSLCLLAQAYEQAYNLLQIFAELEMTVHMLIQIDKLVQLLESPVFTYLRLQLLEPEKYPYLYKCLYGLLMLLPQSSAFAALKNRLNSVSAIGYLHIAPRPTLTPASSSYERPNRLKGREDGGIRWVELLDKFKAVQEKARRQQGQRQQQFAVSDGFMSPLGKQHQPQQHQQQSGSGGFASTRPGSGNQGTGTGSLRPLPNASAGGAAGGSGAGGSGAAGGGANHQKKNSLPHRIAQIGGRRGGKK
ncbi:MAG: hypothetical protein M4579_003036 [Chaenotheca gracillima]|nr:MAG: hypothetical protein M4579_003036 [Chaenotheca gracillima]